MLYAIGASKILGMKNLVRIPDFLAIQSDLYGVVINTNFFEDFERSSGTRIKPQTTHFDIEKYRSDAALCGDCLRCALGADLSKPYKYYARRTCFVTRDKDGYLISTKK